MPNTPLIDTLLKQADKNDKHLTDKQKAVIKEVGVSSNPMPFYNQLDNLLTERTGTKSKTKLKQIEEKIHSRLDCIELWWKTEKMLASMPPRLFNQLISEAKSLKTKNIKSVDELINSKKPE